MYREATKEKNTRITVKLRIKYSCQVYSETTNQNVYRISDEETREKRPSAERANRRRPFPKGGEVASKLFNEAGSLDTEESSEKGTKM